MRAEYMRLLRAGLVLTLVGGAVPTASFAQSTVRHPGAGPAPNTSSGTPEERKACIPDVQDLCEDVVAQEHSVIVACLKSHWEKLSQDCRTVLERRDR